MTRPLYKVRIGNDIPFEWRIVCNGEEVDLEGRDLRLSMIRPNGARLVLPHEVEGNVVKWTLRGVDQHHLGEYSVSLWENYGKPGQSVVDSGAVEIVAANSTVGNACLEHNDAVELGPSDITLGNVVSIREAEQVVTSEESGGENVLRITLSTGRTVCMVVRNGGDGGQGEPGVPGRDLVWDELTDGQKRYIYEQVTSMVEEGARVAQIIGEKLDAHPKIEELRKKAEEAGASAKQSELAAKEAEAQAVAANNAAQAAASKADAAQKSAGDAAATGEAIKKSLDSFSKSGDITEEVVAQIATHSAEITRLDRTFFDSIINNSSNIAITSSYTEGLVFSATNATIRPSTSTNPSWQRLYHYVEQVKKGDIIETWGNATIDRNISIGFTATNYNETGVYEGLTLDNVTTYKANGEHVFIEVPYDGYMLCTFYYDQSNWTESTRIRVYRNDRIENIEKKIEPLFPVEIDIKSLTKYRYYISGGKWATYNARHIYVPVEQGKEYVITTDTVSTNWAFVTTNETAVDGQATNILVSPVTNLPKASSLKVTVPAGANFIYFQVQTSSGNSLMPSSVKSYGLMDQIQSLFDGGLETDIVAPLYDISVVNSYYSVLSNRHAGNTMGHFQHGVNLGFNSLKCDLRLTSDGELILCHDAGYTFNSEGKITTYNESNASTVFIHNVTAEEAKSYVHTDGSNPCLFQEFVLLCKRNGIIPFVTIRDEYLPETLTKMYEILLQYGMDKVSIINLYFVPNDMVRIAKLVKEYCPNCPMCWTGNNIEWSKAWIDYAAANGMRYIYYPYISTDDGALMTEMAKYAGSIGLRIGCNPVTRFDDCVRWGFSLFQNHEDNQVCLPTLASLNYKVQQLIEKVNTLI